MSKVPALALGALLTIGASLPALAQGDADKGQRVFAACKACHTLDAGGKNLVGPNLHGVVGRKAGGASGYKYSDAMLKSGVVWNDEALAKYMADPKNFIPGNKMAFAGVKKDGDRDDLIAYLKKATAK